MTDIWKLKNGNYLRRAAANGFFVEYKAGVKGMAAVLDAVRGEQA